MVATARAIIEMIGEGYLHGSEYPRIAEAVADALRGELEPRVKNAMLDLGMKALDGLEGRQRDCYSKVYTVYFAAERAHNDGRHDPWNAALREAIITLGVHMKAFSRGEELPLGLVSRMEDALLYAASNSRDVQGRLDAIFFLNYSNSEKVWKALGKEIDSSSDREVVETAKKALRTAGERTGVSTGVFARPPPTWFRPVRRLEFFREQRTLRPLIRA